MKTGRIRFVASMLIVFLLLGGLGITLLLRYRQEDLHLPEKSEGMIPDSIESELEKETVSDKELYQTDIAVEEEKLPEPEKVSISEPVEEQPQETPVTQTPRPQAAPAYTNTNTVPVQPNTSGSSATSSTQETSDPQPSAEPTEQTGTEGISDEPAPEAEAASGGLWDNELEIDMG